MAVLGALAINPGVGEGFGIPEGSVRYRVGVWMESYGTVFAIIACWPLMVVDSLGCNPKSPLLWIVGTFIAGTGWVFLWHGIFVQLRRIRRVKSP
jgi:hypothetical protein